MINIDELNYSQDLNPCTSQTQCFVKLKMPIYDGNVSHTTSWHNTDQACTNDTVSVCGAAIAVFPVDGEALALETTAPGTGLSLMICLLLTLPHHIAVILPQSLNCSRRTRVADTSFFMPRGWVMLSLLLLFLLSILFCHVLLSVFSLTTNILFDLMAHIRWAGLEELHSRSHLHENIFLIYGTWQMGKRRKI